jgi:hypothetical protein
VCNTPEDVFDSNRTVSIVGQDALLLGGLRRMVSHHCSVPVRNATHQSEEWTKVENGSENHTVHTHKGSCAVFEPARSVIIYGGGQLLCNITREDRRVKWIGSATVRGDVDAAAVCAAAPAHVSNAP